MFPQNAVPDNLFEDGDPGQLATHLSRFVVEAKKTNGEFYPPSTLHLILCALLRHKRDISHSCPNFLDKKDSRFRNLHGTLDAHFHKLHAEGIGVQVKHTEILTEEDEMKLWESGVVGVATPRALQNAAFLTVGKVFSLRGGVEHRSLKVSQLKRTTNPVSTPILRMYL